MLFAPTKIGVMESKITLEFMAAKIDDLTAIVRRGFGYAEQKFAEIDGRFDDVDRRFEKIEGKLGEFDGRFEVVEGRLVNFEKRFDDIDQSFLAIARQFELIDQRFDAIDKRFDAVERRLDVVERRLTKLEQRVDLVGYSAYNIQVQTENMEQEMKGIHKVIDNLSGRITTVENYLGFPNQNPLFEF